MVGSAVTRALQNKGYRNVVVRSREELDLTRQEAVDRFYDKCRPDAVVIAAAKVGGIMANKTYPADFITINLQIQTNLISGAYRAAVRNLLFLSSSCIYPRSCSQPMAESLLWSGPLEPTNSAYAAAKLAGIEMCRAYHDQYGVRFFSAIPCNLYGVNDNYDPENSHVMAALISKIHRAVRENADSVTFWGTGEPRRELLYVDDLADACVLLLERFHEPGPINIGAGEEHTIRELIELVCETLGFHGRVEFDTSKPDGMMRKLVDSSRIHSLGWCPYTSLREGIAKSYADYLARYT